MVEDLSINNDIILVVCVNCGKEVINNPNTCNKCKAATYCNASCKKKHRKQHKKKCEMRVAELHDIELFKQPPPPEDCPICMLPLPAMEIGKRHFNCCGKIICAGCTFAPVYDRMGNVRRGRKCPFCNASPTSAEEASELSNNRVEAGDANAICSLGMCYSDGTYGLPQNHTKALELWNRAGELGVAGAYYNIGIAYKDGRVDLERDEKKAIYYLELAAMSGHVKSRYLLGSYEFKKGNSDRAVKHWMIAVVGGSNVSLTCIKALFMVAGDATKDDYTKALKSYQAYLGEIRSVQRDAAAAADDNCKYYQLGE